ncbi:uncharacterized protein BJ212DRAFT_1498254 [Suillus subaureus]|uniref:Uncharacterized protein n=1 Tax=Suillus subaureus TaxID=48587 RepID=A0A9P7DPS7_9AGAM|nr:uncharacterized protein BJ212DRAFT_1498254 [Suillus subaureus]KAG1800139.1 hypothetical protein BJ212DRAFT_1498254 [Suillus subaureus]
MSTPVDNSLTGLKASTAQIMAIISGTWQIPPGNSHFSLITQAGSSDQGLLDWTPAQHHAFMLQGAIACLGHDSPGLAQLAQHQVNSHKYNGPIPVDLPSPPICASNVAGPSTSTTTEFWDKGKGKAINADPEPKAEGSRKRKSPMISALSSQLLKSVMKTHKCAKSSCWVTSKPLVDLEDEEDMSIQVLTKKPFGPATVIASSHLAVIEPSQPTPNSLVEAPPVIDEGDILIPGPNNPCQACSKLNWDCTTQLDKRTGNPSLPSSSSAVPAPVPGLAVPAAALNLPMLDLHAMAIAIQDGAAHIAILKAHVAEQDEMTPTPPKFENASAIKGLLFEYNWVVQPEVPDMSGEIVDPGDLGNLVPEYDSSEDMDVEVKVEVSSEEVDMAVTY